MQLFLPVTLWEETKSHLYSSCSIEDKVSSLYSINPHDLRIGSEIVGSIGHSSFGLALRARIGALGQNPVKSYWILNGSSSNKYFLNLWRQHFDSYLDVSLSEQKAIENSLWNIVESIQTVRTFDGYLDLVSAHNKYALAWEEESLPP